MNWELRPRTYVLKGKKPLTFKIKSSNIIWFDEKEKKNKEIRYTTNQNTLFVEEQDKHAKLAHVVFEDGVLHTKRNQPLLQQFLEIYHPQRELWYLIDKAAEAVDEVGAIEKELEALNLVKELSLDHLEAVMRAEIGSRASNMSTKELKRDAYLFAKHNPSLFMELANDDEVELRNIANKAVETGIIKLTDNNTKFKWAANGREIMTVPFDAHPYSAFAQFFKTDEGANVFKSIEKKLE